MDQKLRFCVAHNSRIENCFEQHQNQMFPKSQGKMLPAWLVGPWLPRSSAKRSEAEPELGSIVFAEQSCARGGGTNPCGSPGNWGQHRGREEETKRFQDVSGKYSLEIPTSVTKQDLRGRILLSVPLLRKPSKSGGISQGHFGLGSDVRFPIA